jgi:hypothetical protein
LRFGAFLEEATTAPEDDPDCDPGGAMSTRITFNRQEYAGPEAMPDDVRRAYEDMLARLSADENRDGVPDVLEGNRSGLGMKQISVMINGKPVDVADLPAPARGLLRYVGAFLARSAPRTDPAPNAELTRTIDPIQDRLAGVLRFLSLVVAGAILAVGALMIRDMDASSRSQGGVIYVGIAMDVALVWAMGMFIRASGRRKP